MHVGVVGSRSFPNTELVEAFIRSLCKDTDPIIVSGGAPGVDTVAEGAARRYGALEPKIIPARWQDLSVEETYIKQGRHGPYNALAGFQRNQRIVDTSDVMVSFWHNQSSGTEDTIQRAHRALVPMMVVSSGMDSITATDIVGWIEHNYYH